MSRKLKLASETSYDYTIFGVACHLKDYRFTFFMNEKLGYRFKRVDDLEMGSDQDGKSYSFYLYENPEEGRKYYLISNYHESGRLIPEEKGADFFMIAEGVIPEIPKRKLLKKMQSVSQVLTVYEIPKAKARNLGVIFEEIELHFLG